MAHRQPSDESDSERGGGPRLARARRSVLATIAATGFAGSLAGLASADEEEEEAEPDFVLTARTEGWSGVEPDDIAEEENPTLALEAGESYVLEWENCEDVEHAFALLDEEDEEIERGETLEAEGETETFEFEATEEMVAYHCPFHPEEMRGEVEHADGDEFAFADLDQHTLTLHFENEDGEAVSHFIEGSVVPDEGTIPAYHFDSEVIEDGTLEEALYEAEYEITVTSLEEEFDEVSDEITLEGDEELTLTLEGARPDDEIDEEELEDEDEEEEE
ncbi:hypothetical protein [Halovivax sp.]|uniref:hypothetical protein n=1 Tax=Halovivax sp. TaxID=1935978 RepID=UPI0025B94EC3|nr:hypothetical protein [Halovivax sp.]